MTSICKKDLFVNSINEQLTSRKQKTAGAKSMTKTADSFIVLRPLSLSLPLSFWIDVGALRANSPSKKVKGRVRVIAITI